MKSPRLLQSLSGVPRTYAKPERESKPPTKMKSPRLLQSLSGVPRTYAKPEGESKPPTKMKSPRLLQSLSGVPRTYAKQTRTGIQATHQYEIAPPPAKPLW